MGRLSSIILSIPRTVWFNFRFLPLKYAIKLPIWIANNVRIRNLRRGGIILNSNDIHPGLIRIGYHKVEAIDIYSLHTILDVRNDGRIICNGDVHVGHGAILSVKGGTLTLGMHFAISGNTSIVCCQKISIGDNVQFSCDSLVMDSDDHFILDEQGIEKPNTAPIIIGNDVWIAAKTLILKGTYVGNNCVIAASSILNKEYKESNKLIAGAPAKIVKSIGGWHL